MTRVTESDRLFARVLRAGVSDSTLESEIRWWLIRRHGPRIADVCSAVMSATSFDIADAVLGKETDNADRT